MQALGKDVESVYVEELGQEMSKKEIFNVLVLDPMMGAIEVDWRDFFPYLRWVPNRSMEMKVQRIVARKTAVTRALINEQKKRIALGEVFIPPCFSFFFLVLLLLTMTSNPNIKSQCTLVVINVQEINCYLDFLLSENTLTEEKLTTLIWEAIIEASDTTLVPTEWAMYELAKSPKCQVTGKAHVVSFFSFFFFF